jgi:hypothetical protein
MTPDHHAEARALVEPKGEVEARNNRDRSPLRQQRQRCGLGQLVGQCGGSDQDEISARSWSFPLRLMPIQRGTDAA